MAWFAITVFAIIDATVFQVGALRFWNDKLALVWTSLEFSVCARPIILLSSRRLLRGGF